MHVLLLYVLFTTTQHARIENVIVYMQIRLSRFVTSLPDVVSLSLSSCYMLKQCGGDPVLQYREEHGEGATITVAHNGRVPVIRPIKTLTHTTNLYGRSLGPPGTLCYLPQECWSARSELTGSNRTTATTSVAPPFPNEANSVLLLLCKTKIKPLRCNLQL